MSGRKPKPTALKRLAGNPGKRALNDREPKFRQATMRAPRHLGKEGKKEWRRVAQELDAVGLLTVVDRAALAAYCEAWETWIDATRQVREEGMVLVSATGYAYPHPAQKIRERAMAQMLKFAAEFGMTPSSRSRIKMPQADEPDELERLLFGERVAVADG